MTREQAFELAQKNHRMHTKAEINRLFGRAGAFDAVKDYGFRNGWYVAAGHSFSCEEITGEKYDITQGGWSHI